MELFGLFGSKDSRAERRAARRAAAARRAEKRKASRAAAASRAQVDAFLRYLDTQTSGSYYGNAASVARREGHQDDARYIVSFYREHLAKHGQESRAASLSDLLVLVSPDHEGWGLSRYSVEYWISDYESTQRPAGQRKRR
jgi:hypothetical protein